MRKMKDSGIAWIGEIPEEWEISKMKYLIKVSSGEYISKELYSTDGEYPIVGSNGEIGRSYKCNVKDKVITTGRVGSVGTTYLIENAWVSDNALIIRNSLDIDQIYLKQVIPCFDFKNILSGTAQPLITASALKNQYIPFPPLNEQRRIAAFLDEKCAHIDAVIEKTRVSIDEYKKLKQAIITRAVTKGLRQGRKMKDSGIEWIGKIPEEWNVQKLKYCTDFIQEKYDNTLGELSYIGLENIISGNGQFAETESQYDKMQSLVFQKDDILFGKLRPYLAKVYHCAETGCCSGEFCVIRVYESHDVRYFWNLLISSGFIEMVDFSTYGAKMPRANADFIRNIYIPLPPLPEQQEIAAYLDAKTAAIDRLIAKKEQLIAEMQSCKKSLIYEVVTGKREVAI